MNRTKWLFPLSIVIMAVLLIIAAPAQAGKKIKPGDDNPGSTGEPISLEYVGFFGGAGDGCFNPDLWCIDRSSDFERDVVSGSGDYYGNAKAAAWARSDCDAGAMAHAGTLGIVRGQGELLLRRHGNHGAMHHIDLNADFSSTNIFFATAKAFANTYASVRTTTHAFVKAWAEPSNGGPPIKPEVFCGDEHAAEDVFLPEFCAWAVAMGDTHGGSGATSFGNGWGGIAGGSTAGLELWNSVYASNIELYHTIASASAGGFFVAEGSANALAISSAYESIFMKVYAEVCDGYYDILGFQEICSESLAYARARARASARAYASAYAKAWAATEVGVKMKAVYYNADGNDDPVKFAARTTGLPYSDAILHVSCGVPQ